MRGRKPKPVEQHRAEGTYRPDRHGGPVPEADGKAPAPPPFLRGTALREWWRIVPLLKKKGVIDLVDQSVLAAYCQARQELSQAVYKLRREGYYYTTRSGSIRLHPAAKERDSANTRLVRLAAELGLTPSARSRVKLEHDPDIDPEESEYFD